MSSVIDPCMERVLIKFGMYLHGLGFYRRTYT